MMSYSLVPDVYQPPLLLFYTGTTNRWVSRCLACSVERSACRWPSASPETNHLTSNLKADFEANFKFLSGMYTYIEIVTMIHISSSKQYLLLPDWWKNVEHGSAWKR